MNNEKNKAKSSAETVKKNGAHVTPKGKEAAAKATPNAKGAASGAPSKVKEANDMIAEGSPVVPGTGAKVGEARQEVKGADAHVEASAR